MCVLLILLLQMATTLPLHAKPVAEILHFWTSPGEREALDIFADAYRQRGGEWYALSVPSSDDLRREASNRIADGYPPTAMQWHAGPDLAELDDLELINDLSAVVNTDALKEQLLPLVLEAVSIDDRIVVIPTNIHGDNWAWYNLGIYRELGLELPRSWTDFLAQAPLIKEAGHVPLAIGASRWEHRLLFNTILIDVGGPDAYMHLARNLPLTEMDKVALREALKVYLDLRDYVDDDWLRRGRWSDSTQLVIDGKAALQVMGDWAKSEFIGAGMQPGVGFACKMAPGNEQAYLVVIDVFALSRTDDPTQRWIQAMLVETMLDPKVQRRFALAKGALPVRKDVDLDGYDSCARYGWNVLRNPAHQFPAPTLIMNEPLAELISSVLAEAWDNPVSQADVVAEQLLTALPGLRR